MLSLPKSSDRIDIHTKLVYIPNRTGFYLAPVLNHLSEALVRRINRTGVLAFAINDIEYVKGKGKHHYCLFILHVPEGMATVNPDQKVRSRHSFQRYLDYVRKQRYYIDDYRYTLQGKPLHVVAVQINRSWYKAYEAFLQGKFSSMYSRRDLHKVRIKPRTRGGHRNAVFEVLTQADRYHEIFEREVNDLFGTNVIMDTVEEYDSHHLHRSFEVLNATEAPGFDELLLTKTN